jgi:hypothetical protein
VCDQDFVHVEGEETKGLMRELKKTWTRGGELVCVLVALWVLGLIFLCGRERERKGVSQPLLRQPTSNWPCIL